MDHLATGKQGEDRAQSYLESLGYTILDRNRRYKIGEVDILAQDGDQVVVVEVKAGATGKFGLALERVGPQKKRKLCLLANRVWQDYPRLSIRIDVLNVDDWGEVIHIKNAVEFS